MRALSEKGSGKSVIVVRLLPGEDLITGIEHVCEKHQIKYGVITACIGSLEKLYLNYYFEPKDPNEPFSPDRDLILEQPVVFLSAQGLICENTDGSIDVHLHGVVRDNKGNIYGSHIPKGGNIVQYTVDIAITVIEDMRLIREFDEETQHLMTKPLPL